MPQHLSKGFMFIDQLLDTIIIGVMTRSKHPQHENLPLCHSGVTVVGIDFDTLSVDLTNRQYLFQDGKYWSAHLRCCVDMLEPTQDLRDITA